MPNDPRFQPGNALPWWAANGPLRITVHPYAPASGSSDNASVADGTDDWFVPSNGSGGSSDGDDSSFPPLTTSDDTQYAPNAWAGSTDANSVNPFAAPRFDSFPSAPYPPPRVQPLVSPAVSDAVAWGLPVFPKDMLGFDPTKIPASEWSTEPPIFLRGLLGAFPANSPPSTWPALAGLSEGSSPQSSPTAPAQPGVLPDSLLSQPPDGSSSGILPYAFDTGAVPSAVSVSVGRSGPSAFERFVHLLPLEWRRVPDDVAEMGHDLRTDPAEFLRRASPTLGAFGPTDFDLIGDGIRSAAAAGRIATNTLGRSIDAAANAWREFSWGRSKPDINETLLERDPAPSVTSSEAPAASQGEGGTYLLRDPETGEIMRTGRSKSLRSRKGQHRRAPTTKQFDFEPVHRTNDYNEQRGLEQVLHEQYNPPLNKINPIDPRNRYRSLYMDAARRYLGQKD